MRWDAISFPCKATCDYIQMLIWIIRAKLNKIAGFITNNSDSDIWELNYIWLFKKTTAIFWEVEKYYDKSITQMN